MNTYTITITAVFDAEDEAEAIQEFRQWIVRPGCVEEGAEISVQRDEEAYAADWRYEVANGDTRLGLDEWIAHREEAGE